MEEGERERGRKGKRGEGERWREREERERAHHPNLDDLPEQSKDKVRPSLHDVLGSDVDDIASDGAGRVEGQCLVLLHCEHIQLALVDGSLVNSVGDRGVDQLAVSEREKQRDKERQRETKRESKQFLNYHVWIF